MKVGDLVKVKNGKFAGAVGHVVEVLEEAIEAVADAVVAAVENDAQAVTDTATEAPAADPVTVTGGADPAIGAVTVTDTEQKYIDKYNAKEAEEYPATEGKPGQVRVHISGIVNGESVDGMYWFNPDDLEVL